MHVLSDMVACATERLFFLLFAFNAVKLSRALNYFEQWYEDNYCRNYEMGWIYEYKGYPWPTHRHSPAPELVKTAPPRDAEWISSLPNPGT